MIRTRLYETRLFDWAEREGLDIPALAKMLEYGERQLYRYQAMHRRHGYVTKPLRDRAVAAMGDYARSFFVPCVTVDTGTTPGCTANALATPPISAPAGRESGREGVDTVDTVDGRTAHPDASEGEAA